MNTEESDAALAYQDAVDRLLGEDKTNAFYRSCPSGDCSHACLEAEDGFTRFISQANQVCGPRERAIYESSLRRSAATVVRLTICHLLRREILEVIHRYVNIDPSAVQVNVGREDGQEVLELSVSLPVKPPTVAQGATRT